MGLLSSHRISLEKTYTNPNSKVFIVNRISDGRLALCCEYGVIQILNLSSMEIDIMIKEPNEIYIEMNTFSDNRVLLASAQGMMSLFKIRGNTYEKLAQIDTYTNAWIIKVIILNDYTLCSITRNNKILFFESEEPYSELKVIETKERLCSIYQMKKDKDNLICFYNDDSIHLFELNTYTVVKSIYNVECYSRRSMLEISDDKMLIGGENKISLFDVKIFQVESIIVNNEFDRIESFLSLDDNTVVIGCGNQNNGNVLVIEMEKYAIIDRIDNVHTINVDSLGRIDESMFISSSWDHKINIYLNRKNNINNIH